MSAYLLLMTENEGPQNWITAGHYTKDQDSVMVLISNLFAIMNEKD